MTHLITVNNLLDKSIHNDLLPTIGKIYKDRNIKGFNWRNTTMHVCLSRTNAYGLIDTLKRCNSYGIIVIEVLDDDIPNTGLNSPFAMSAIRFTRWLSDELKLIRTTKWFYDAIVLVSRKGALPESSKISSHLWIDYKDGDPKVKRMTLSKIRKLGDELSPEVSKALVNTITGIDVDGDLSYWGFVQQNTGIYPKGMHPYLMLGYKLKSYEPHAPNKQDQCVPRELLKELHEDNDTVYQMLLIDAFITHPDVYQEIYGDMAPLVDLEEHLHPRMHDIITNTVASQLSKIDEFSNGALIGIPNVESYHPYMIKCIVDALHEHQFISFNGVPHSKAALQLLLKYCPLWCRTRLNGWSKLIAANNFELNK